MTEQATCHHDFENATHPSRAVWLCPKCGKDISIEYLFWFEAAYPEEEDE